MIFTTLNFEMPSFCAVVGCGSRGNRDKNSFFRIPCIPTRGQPEMIALKTERRMKWILALRRKDLTETKLKYALICDRHFISGRPAAIRDIYNTDWVPSQNMGYDTTSKNGNQTTTKAIICYVTPCNPQHGEKETVDSESVHNYENSQSKVNIPSINRLIKMNCRKSVKKLQFVMLRLVNLKKLKIRELNLLHLIIFLLDKMIMNIWYILRNQVQTVGLVVSVRF